MFNRFVFWPLTAMLLLSCNNKSDDQQSTAVDSSARPELVTSETPSTLPSFVVFRNWEQGNAENSQVILSTYKAWDSDSTGAMASYFGDTTRFDLPDGRRFTIDNNTIESTLRKWRKNYKQTSNIPFSLIPLHNKDLDQQWVIAWTWNTWINSDGTKDSMLYCDNWRFKDGKIVYLNSLQNQPSKGLLKTLNKVGSK